MLRKLVKSFFTVICFWVAYTTSHSGNQPMRALRQKWFYTHCCVQKTLLDLHYRKWSPLSYSSKQINTFYSSRTSISLCGDFQFILCFIYQSISEQPDLSHFLRICTIQTCKSNHTKYSFSLLTALLYWRLPKNKTCSINKLI